MNKKPKKLRTPRPQRPKTTAGQPNASWPVASLLHSLRNAHWGPLSGARHRGTRTILETLADLMTQKHSDLRGEVATTIYELGERAGYGRSWTRSRLLALEDLGLISWTRGRIESGRPTAGLIRVNKRALVALARPMKDAALAEHRAATLERIRVWSLWWNNNSPHRFRRSRHVSLDDRSLLLIGEDPMGVSSPKRDLLSKPLAETQSSVVGESGESLVEIPVRPASVIGKVLEVLRMDKRRQDYNVRCGYVDMEIYYRLRRGLPVKSSEDGRIVDASCLEMIA